MKIKHIVINYHRHPNIEQDKKYERDTVEKTKNIEDLKYFVLVLVYLLVKRTMAIKQHFS